jgi:prophage antirepressor-like protein
MPESEPQFTLIPFRGQEILCVTKDNKRFIVPKQICENLGISWSGQFERLKRDTVLNDGIRVIRIPQNKKIDRDTASKTHPIYNILNK